MEEIRNRNINKIYTVASIAMMSALTAVGAWITIPYTVPFTMQTFAVFLTAVVIGGKKGTLSVLIYILCGAAGLPVFSAFRSGLGTLFGPTGGYITGFIFITLLFWLFEKRLTKPLYEYMTGITGLLICYLFGTVQFVAVSASAGSKMSFIGALGVCVLPYIIPDLIKLSLAITLGRRIKKIINNKIN